MVAGRLFETHAVGSFSSSSSSFLPFFALVIKEIISSEGRELRTISFLKSIFFFFFLGCPEAIDLLGQLCRDRTVRKAVGKGWGNWSGRGLSLLPLAQRSKQVVFHLCCSLC